MKKVLSIVLLVLFAGSVMVFTGCGKGDKSKLIDTKNKFTEFMKTDDYKKIMDDPGACGKKMEEFAKASGFKDFKAYIDASSKLMSDPEVNKIDMEQMKMNEALKVKK
jgi:hypothetical protein